MHEILLVSSTRPEERIRKRTSVTPSSCFTINKNVQSLKMRIWDTQIKFWRNISLSLIFPRERKVTKNIAFNQLGSRSMSWIVNFSLPDGHPGAERSFLSDYPLKCCQAGTLRARCLFSCQILKLSFAHFMFLEVDLETHIILLSPSVYAVE